MNNTFATFLEQQNNVDVDLKKLCIVVVKKYLEEHTS